MYILVPIPPISNNTRAIPAVILIVNLLVFVYDIEIVRRYVGIKSIPVFYINLVKI